MKVTFMKWLSLIIIVYQLTIINVRLYLSADKRYDNDNG